MYRALIHHWRVNLAVLLGAAVATAVLTGALLVGDSVRGSLRELTLDRLGRVDSALVTQRFFDAGLADRLAGFESANPPLGPVAPAIVVRGAAVQPDSGARAAGIAIHGIDERFASLFDQTLDFEPAAGQIFPSVVINETLRKELAAEVGDSLVLSFGRQADVPRDTLMGETSREDVVGSLRLTVTAVLPDAGMGRFGLAPAQQNPANAFLALDRLQRTLGFPGEVNALFAVHRRADADPGLALAATVGLEDLGLTVREGEGHFVLESREFVLRPNLVETLRSVTGRLNAPLLSTQSYLANQMRLGDRVLPYSMVAALDPDPAHPWSALTLQDGTPIRALSREGILLNRWAADDLQAAVGDDIVMEYFVVGPREELVVARTTLKVEGILAWDGLALDSNLTPDYPGVRDADDMAAWDPPFPVDLGLIRAKDEDYWDRYRATPKAFVSAETGRELWSTRFGSVTAARIGAAPGLGVAQTRAEVRRGLLAELPPPGFGLQFREVKREGLEASAGATDFAGLFVAFSSFLIASSALLVGLLFGLNVERRAREIGLLLAVGHPLRAVRRRLVAEGAVLAALGALLGLLAGIGYASALMAALRSIWLPAVGSSALFLHVGRTSLALGWTIAVVVILFAVFVAVRRVRKVPPPALLAGSLQMQARKRSGRLNRVLSFGTAGIAVVLVAYAISTGNLESPALAFGSGTLLLISGLAFFTGWCRRSKRGRQALSGGLVGMAARNSSWSPGRSVLSVALVACASFVIVTVTANRQHVASEGRESGSGGFGWVAESDVPLYQDLNRDVELSDLGFSEESISRLQDVEVLPFRFLPGDDASCLNLYQPERPRVLGVPQELVQRGGFSFKQTLGLPEGEDNPWSLLDAQLEPGVIPAIGDYNSMMWIMHLGLGQEQILEDEYGVEVRLRLVGMLDKSILQSELLISERNFLAHFPSHSGYSYFLVDAPAESRDIATLLESRLDSYGFDITTTADKLAAYQVVEHTYLSTFQLLGGLGLLLGTVGLSVVLVRNVIERRGELATLRACGFRRSDLSRLVLAENAFLLFVGMTIGSVSALAAVAPRLAALHVPWGALVGTLGVIFVTGMLSSAVAVLGALRVPLMPVLKSER